MDLAKSVFQAHVANGAGHVIEQKRLTRHQFRKLLYTAPVSTIVMEACGSAHYWGREAIEQRHTVKLLPAQHVKPYVRNNKTDELDSDGLLRAHGDKTLHPVPVRSEDLQVLQSLHRIRQIYENQRKALMNLVRGLLREFGVVIPQRVAVFDREIQRALASVPTLLRETLTPTVVQITELVKPVREIDQTLLALARENDTVKQLMTIPGIGVLNSTALYANVVDIHRYSTGRKFSASLGIVAKVSASGGTIHLGAITKRGNKYLRMLLIHGGRSVLLAASRKRKAGKGLSSLESWGLEVAVRRGHNKACVAVANKLARIVWAVWSNG